MREALLHVGLEVFDAFNLTRHVPKEGPFFLDSVHFSPAIYRGLNEALVAQLCGSSGGWLAQPHRPAPRCEAKRPPLPPG